MKLAYCLLIFSFGLSVGASEPMTLLKAQKPGDESRIPAEVIREIKKKMENKSEDGKTKELAPAFLSVEVSLFDRHGVIDPPVKAVTPAGGGTVDLERVLPEGKAKFSLKMKVTDAVGEEVTPDTVFFIPRISEKKDGKELNCGKYFDVTHYFNSKVASQEGVETYLTEGIYASSFLGTFVFVKKKEKELALGHLNFVDGRFHRWLCPTEAKAEPAK